jgi:hypothetical protein
VRVLLIWRDLPCLLDSLKQLPVAKGIIDKDSVIALQRLVMRDCVSGICQSRRQSRQIIHEEGRMRLSRRRKILLDAEMNLQFTIFKPAATARGEFRWFHRLWNSEDTLLEFPGLGLPPGWHG